MARLTYLVVLGVVAVMALLPLGLALALGRGLGWICYRVVGLRAGVVRRNLRHVLGASRSDAEIDAIACASYGQFAMTLVELLRSVAPFTLGRGLERNVTFDDLTELERLRDAKRPVICVQGHIGNFDLAAYAFAGRGFPHHTVMRAVKNPYVNSMVVNVREKHGVTVHEKGPETGREIRDLLGRGEWLGILPDQNAKERGVTVDFLGQPASLYRGAASFHLETGAPLCVAVDERSRTDPRKHHVGYEILPPAVRTGDEEADVRAVMQQVADALGRKILRNPEQYFWMHRLWGKAMHREAEKVGAGAAAG